MKISKIEVKVLSKEELQDARWREVLERVQDFEAGLYEASFDTTAEKAGALHDKAWDLLEEVLGRYELAYSNVGEPNAEKDVYEVYYHDGQEEPSPVQYELGLQGAISVQSAGRIVIALSNGDDGLRTSEEEEAENKYGDSLLRPDLYWARLRTQQAKDILEQGWQSGLEEPLPVDPPPSVVGPAPPE